MLSLTPPLLSAGLPVNSATFMFAMVMMASVAAVLIAFNLLSLKHHSTNRLSVLSAVLLLVGIMVNNTGIGANYESGSLDPSSTILGLIALAMVALSAACCIASLVQFATANRFRRGRKRSIVTLLGCLLFFAFALTAHYYAQHPRPRSVPKSNVELLPEATPEPRHTTPPPPRALPSVISPTKE